MRRFVIVAMLTCWAGMASAIDETAFVRKSCGALTPCFTNLADLQTWVTTVKIPAPGNRLVVDIGAGEWEGPYHCLNSGYTTLRGSGRDQTIIVENGTTPLPATLAAADCFEFGVQDLSVRNDGGGHGVLWSAGGTSTFSNVDVFGSGSAWYDWACSGDPSVDPPLGEHYFFGTRLWGRVNGFFGECGESWFYGGDIAAFFDAGSGFGVFVGHRADVRVFGSTVRSIAEPGASLPAVGVAVGVPFSGAQPEGFGEFHMHGGIISVNSMASGSDATGLLADRGEAGTALAHTNDTAFTLQVGPSATATRTSGPGIRSPYLWEAGEEPPIPGLVSQSGYDMFVETDCHSSGVCDGTGSDPHLMLYSESCPPGNPWFDVVAGACRP